VEPESTETADRIEQAAFTLLADAPWESISTRQICAAADVTAPTLYHHFGDKRGLGRAVANRAFLRYFVGERTRAHSDDAVARLRFAWDAHVEFGLTHRALYSLMFGEGRADDDLPGAVVARAVFREILGDLAARGALRAPVDRAALVLEGSLVGATFQAIRSGFDADVSTHLREAVLASVVTELAAAQSRDPNPVRVAAVQLGELLAAGDSIPRGEVLGAEETALLQKWLTALGA
jgi:AcrR family transcriptional regulator